MEDFILIDSIDESNEWQLKDKVKKLYEIIEEILEELVNTRIIKNIDKLYLFEKYAQGFNLIQKIAQNIHSSVYDSLNQIEKNFEITDKLVVIELRLKQGQKIITNSQGILSFYKFLNKIFLIENLKTHYVDENFFIILKTGLIKNKNLLPILINDIQTFFKNKNDLIDPNVYSCDKNSKNDIENLISNVENEINNNLDIPHKAKLALLHEIFILKNEINKPTPNWRKIIGGATTTLIILSALVTTIASLDGAYKNSMKLWNIVAKNNIERSTNIIIDDYKINIPQLENSFYNKNTFKNDTSDDDVLKK